MRVVTALVGAPVILVAAYLGGLWFAAVILVIALGSMLEVRKLFASVGLDPFVWAALLLSVLIVVKEWVPYASYLQIAVATLTIASIPFLKGDRIPERAAATFFVVLYPVWLLSFMLDIRLGRALALDDEALGRVAVLIFLLVWAGDTVAFYVGRSFGSRPFFPSISPKKTWEGFAGGLVGTIVVGLAAKGFGLVDLAWIDVAAVTAICGIGGPVGDLVESKLKRAFAVKDSGSLLPGHGGMLDRFDAILFCAPLLWMYLSLVA